MKKKKLFLIVSLVFTSLGLFSQINVTDNWLEQQIRVNFLLSPSFEYERPIVGDFAISGKVGVLYAPSWGEPWSNVSSKIYSFEGDTFYYALFPYAQLDFKYIYNRKRRTLLGRKLPYNSGDYIAIRVCYYYNSVLSNHDIPLPSTTYGAYPVWGLQRALGKRGRIHFAFDVGIPYGEDYLGNKAFILKLNLNLGYNIKSWIKRPKRSNMEPDHSEEIDDDKYSVNKDAANLSPNSKSGLFGKRLFGGKRK